MDQPTFYAAAYTSQIPFDAAGSAIAAASAPEQVWRLNAGGGGGGGGNLESVLHLIATGILISR
jgi:hypothetical protein